MRILVTGATGFIGIEVARQLAADGHRPRVMVRRITRAPLLANLDIEAVHGDMLSPPSLERAVDGVDAVIHLAGRATFESYRQLEPSLVQGSEALARAAATAGVKHMVFGSSLFVYPDTVGGIDDGTEAAPVLAYGRAKLDAEKALRSVGAATGLGTALVRLPHVYGPQSALFGLARRRLIVMPGRGDNTFGQLHVKDAARLLIAVAVQSWAGTAPVADGRNATWHEFFDVLRSYAPRIRVLRVPAPLAGGLSALGGPVLGSLGPTLISRDTVRGWNLNLPVVTDRLWNELNLEPEFPSITEGIPAVLDDAVAFRWRHSVFDLS